MKKFMTGILLLIFLLGFQNVFSANTGTCGENVKYAINGNTINFSKANTASAATWGTDCGVIFKKNSAITIVNINDPIRVIDGNSLFKGFEWVKKMYLSKLDVSNVSDMYRMFYNCWSLTSLDVFSWNTSNVINMGDMFDSCSSLTSLDVSYWNTGNVTSMSNMFMGCRSLTTLDVSKWNTSNVISLSGMFDGCWELNSLDVSKWDTSNVIFMGNMFCNCWNLLELDVSNWNTAKVRDMSWMFCECSSLMSLDVSSWDTGNVKDLLMMFYDCSPLITITLGKNSLKNNIFVSLHEYYDFWYYISVGPDANKPLAIGSSTTYKGLFDNYNYNTMAGTWSV